MSSKEARRLDVIERAARNEITAVQAAGLLKLSVRHVKRLKGEYKKIGPAALAHGNRGRKPKHALSDETRQLIVESATGDFRGASLQHMAELFAEHKRMALSPKTIGRVLSAAGIANRHSHKAPRRRRARERMPAPGLLVQGDASPFAWFEGRGPAADLHGFIDDATGMILALHFRPTEDMIGYLTCLKLMVEKHGVPGALYTDRSTIFFSPDRDKLSIDDELAGRQINLTQFGQALDALGIRHIAAHSPQAKGRVERMWQTLQERLVVELRLAHISTIDEANAFLPAFIERHNSRFAVQAQREPAFRPAPPPVALADALALKATRIVSNGSTISFDGQTYQLADRRNAIAPLRPRSRVTVLTHLDGSLSATADGCRYALHPCAKPRPATVEPRPQAAAPQHAHIPADNHPWRRKFITPSDPRNPFLACRTQQELPASTQPADS